MLSTYFAFIYRAIDIGEGGVALNNPTPNLLSIYKGEEAFCKFRQDHAALFENAVVRRFFEEPHHMRLLSDYLSLPSYENQMILEQTFQRYFFRVRFTSYMSSIIKYANMDYQRKYKKDEDRELLIFDKPIDEEEDVTLGEFLFTLTDGGQQNEEVHSNPNEFAQSLDNDELYLAFGLLTDRQKLVITLSYSSYALDKEIAATLSVSQQAITKTRILALTKLRDSLVVHQSGEGPEQRRGAG